MKDWRLKKNVLRRHLKCVYTRSETGVNWGWCSTSFKSSYKYFFIFTDILCNIVSI